MDAIEKRAVIKYLVKKGMCAQDIYKDMIETLGDDSPSLSTIKRWTAQFKRGRASLEDDPRVGRPRDATSDEKVEAVHSTVLNDRRVTVRYLAEIVGISKDSVATILSDRLHMKKLSARWVPRMLTAAQKQMRVETSEVLLEQFKQNPENFLHRIVTQDETWVHHFDPETKLQSKMWKHLGSPPPRKFKVLPSSSKIMASVFWDREGVIMIDYLERGHTITGHYYAEELRRLRQAIKDKRRGKLRAGVLLLQDNAPAHTSHVATSTAKECGFEILPHPPYSPDLAPSDYHLFPKLKSVLRGQRFESDDDVMHAVETFLQEQTLDFYTEGLSKLESRWHKCIEVGGDYVEK